MASNTYSKIVVAVDGSSTSDLALQEAIRVASGSGATVLALYVVDNGVMLFDAGFYDPSQIERAYVDSGKKSLEAAGQVLGAANVKFETRLVTEPAVMWIAQDLVSMTARSPWTSRLMMR